MVPIFCSTAVRQFMGQSVTKEIIWIINIMVWDVMPCTLAYRLQHFGGTWCLDLEGKFIIFHLTAYRPIFCFHEAEPFICTVIS